MKAKIASSPVIRPKRADHSSRVLSPDPLIFPLTLTVVLIALGLFSGARTNAHLAETYGTVAAFLLCWQAWLWRRSKREATPLAWEFAATPAHYVQALVQLSVYAYWAYYWPNVRAEAPKIASQLVYLYAFDALLTWSRGQTWRLGFGPWPIILSTNLFLWFRDDWFALQFVMVSLGGLGKQFIRWQRGGKLTHIFNPSAFGLAVVSLILLCTGTTDLTWGREIASTQDQAPHMFTEIFLSSLVVQYLFSVTLLTFSAAAVLGLITLAYLKVTGFFLFVNTNIPAAVFLGLHLLMTDPATTPRSSLGKTIFGSLYGLGVCVSFLVLDAWGAPEFYDKLLIVPVLNLFTPLLDRLASLGAAGKYSPWEARVGLRRMNLAYMGVWAALFLTARASGFVEAQRPHPGSMLASWIKAADANRPEAADRLRAFLDLLDHWDSNPGDPALVAQTNGSAVTIQWKANPEVRIVVRGGSAGVQGLPQAFGDLYYQAASIYTEGKIVAPNPAKAALYSQRAREYGNKEACISFAIDYFRNNPEGEQGNLGQVLSVLEQSSATSPDGRVCYILGFAYNNGRGRPLDRAKARQFYQTGAELGEKATWYPLALMQLRGEGGAPDPAAAARWLEKSADANHGLSCFYLALMCGKGDGINQDEKKADALLEKACRLGVAAACETLQTVQKVGWRDLPLASAAAVSRR